MLYILLFEYLVEEAKHSRMTYDCYQKQNTLTWHNTIHIKVLKKTEKILESWKAFQFLNPLA